MNECLNSDDDDEEDHRWFSSRFFTMHFVLWADAGQTVHSHHASCFDPILVVHETQQHFILTIPGYGEYNGLMC